MAEEKIKLPRSSYEELCKIIMAYGRIAQPTALDQITALTGVGKTVISANNSFLATIGVIDGGKLKASTSLGRELAQAIEHQIPDKVSSKWREVVEGNEFLNKMVLAINIRKSMEIISFESHIAYSAGETKSKQVMTGARAVIDILRVTGLVREEDDKIVPGEPISAALTPEETISVPAQQDSASQNVINVISKQIPTRLQPLPTGNVSLHIEVRIEAKPSELDGLGQKLKEILNSLSDEETCDEPDED